MLDELRSALLGRNARIEELEVSVNGSKQKIHVRQATMESQGKLLAKLQRAAKSEDPEALNAAKISFVIECAVDPSTGQPIFNDRDLACLKTQPCAGWIDEVYELASQLMRSSPRKTCQAEKEPGKVCGCELVLGAPFCPWCGADVPSAAEVAEKNS